MGLRCKICTNFPYKQRVLTMRKMYEKKISHVNLLFFPQVSGDTFSVHFYSLSNRVEHGNRIIKQ